MKRRTFLRGIGGALVAAPLLSTAGKDLFAQTDPAPKRLVVFFQPNGVNIDQFWPTKTNGMLTASDFAGRGIAPLAEHADKLLIPRGIHMSPKGFGLDGIAGCDHRKGMACKLTAVPTLDDGRNYSTGTSIDHVAARSIQNGDADPLVLQVGRSISPTDGGATDFVSYAGSNNPVAGQNNPANVYRRLMGILPGSEAEYSIDVRRQSINDLVREDLTALRRVPMSMDDQRRLDDWQALIRDTEVRMTATCSMDTPDALGILGVERFDGMNNNQVGSDSEYREVGGLMMRMVALSLLCDDKRSAVVQWSRGSGGPTFRWDGLSHEFNHHQLSHRNGTDGADAADIPGIELRITEVDQWYAARYAELIGLMDSFEESNGTLLDNSAVMWINELSDGKAHHFNNLPIILAGSAGGYLKQGQVIDCSTQGITAINGAPHNKLLCTLLNAVGARDTDGGPFASFGDLNFGEPGEFEELKA